MELSLVVPAYNEEKNIISVVTQMLQFLDLHFNSFELIIVDDGSKDKTVDQLHTINHLGLKILPLGVNQGKGQAIKKGMSVAKGKYCFFTDADLPYRLDSILEAIKVFKNKQSDLVLGSRHLYHETPDHDYPLHRKIMSKVFSLYITLTLNLGISDTQCGFKGFTQEVSKKIFPMITIKGFGFDVEMLFIAKKNKYKIESIPVNMNYTDDSKVNILTDSIKMMGDTLKVRINHIKGKYKG